ncbi:MAG TPA: hypothetical protein VFW03_08685 [Gemmatimonadaceae bacterium]|nr:hypothetical protein [Gemmatimonadaceae bacterium]
MTAPAPLSAWIRGRSPAPPPHLLSRIEALAAHAARAPKPAADALLDAALAAMTDLLRGGCLTRSAGFDLLAVDALVTYVFEAAADDPRELDARTGNALARISALAEPPHG